MSQTDLLSWREVDEKSKVLPGYKELLQVVQVTDADFITWLDMETNYITLAAGVECTLLAARIRTEALKRKAGERCWWR